MEQRERQHDQEEVFRQAVRGLICHIMTAVPVKIDSFDPDTLTVNATVQQMTYVQQQDTSWRWTKGPQLVRCPVIFPSGAGFTFFAPPKVGDEALAIFAARSIDEWWAKGGQQPRKDLRMHSIHDGFVLAGIWNQTRIPADIDPDAVEIRNTAGDVKIRLEATGITIASATEVNLTAPAVNVEGSLVINGVAIA